MEGKKLSIYSLEYKDKSEIRDFFQNSESDGKILSGFHRILEYIADEGIKLPSNFYKIIKRSSKKFYQIEKGNHRLTFTRFENRVLLLTHFTKTKQYQKEEYDRVVRLLNKIEGIKWQD